MIINLATYIVLSLYLVFTVIIIVAGNDPTISDNAPAKVIATGVPPSTPTGSKVVFCYQPDFFTGSDCRKTDFPAKNISKMITLDFSKLPFNDQWWHIDILPTESALKSNTSMKIKYAMVQISDMQDRIIGRISEQIPCEALFHSSYLKNDGEINELYQRPGPGNFIMIECSSTDELNYNSPPTVGVFNFSLDPAQAFYVNIAFTKEEGDYIENLGKWESIFVRILLVDVNNVCHLHSVTVVHPIATHKNGLTFQHNPDVMVPVRCHSGTFNMKMHSLIKDKTLSWDDVEFRHELYVGVRPRRKIPHISKPDWSYKINLHNLLVNGVDAEGYTAEERWLEELKISESLNYTSFIHNGSTLINQNVPLVDVIEDLDEVGDNPVGRKFNADDMDDCNDNMRINKPENVRMEMNKVYLDCTYSKMCDGEPEGCLKERDCDLVVSWGKEGNYVVFTVIANQVAYVAVGVSKDVFMGNDSVTECVRIENDVVAGYTSWNFKNGNNRGNVRRRSCAFMKDFAADMADSAMFCTWKRPVVTNVKDHKFDLNEPFHLLVAKGQTSSDGIYGNIEKHYYKRVVGKSAEVFNKYASKSPIQYWISRLHGISMLVIWMFVAPVATFTARYLKGTFVNSRLHGFSVWFAVHGVMMAVVIIINTVATAVLPFINNYEMGKGLVRFSWHAFLGMIMFLMIFVQIILAYQMLKKQETETKRRHKLIKYFHGICGHLLGCCCHVCILTSRHIKDGLPCHGIITPYTIYLSLSFILHLFMSYLVCYSDFVRGRESSRIYSIFIVTRDKKYDLPRRPRPRRLSSIEAEKIRRRRLHLDDLDIEKLEDGAVINPVNTDLSEKDFELDHVEEESGSLVRKIIFAMFIILTFSFTFYFFYLMMYPKLYVDCESDELMKPAPWMISDITI